jgi:hypothetical protein
MEALTAHLKEEDSKIEKVSPNPFDKTNNPNCFQRSLMNLQPGKGDQQKFLAGLSFKSVMVPKVENNTSLSRKSPWSRVPERTVRFAFVDPTFVPLAGPIPAFSSGARWLLLASRPASASAIHAHT